jgi:hypothetical protein
MDSPGVRANVLDLASTRDGLMCFSATASFATAAVTGATGIVATVRSVEARDMPLAAIPIFFSIQQALEGFLWLTLPVAPDGAQASLLTDAFLLFALVFWPAFAPFVAWLIDPDVFRRKLIAVPMMIGWAVAAYLLWMLVIGEHRASIVDGHIAYENNPGAPFIVGLLYLVATAGAPLLSSHAAVRALGLTVLAGSLLAYVLYTDAFVSVWCFFAAAASGVILVHFEQVRAQRRAALAGE